LSQIILRPFQAVRLLAVPPADSGTKALSAGVPPLLDFGRALCGPRDAQSSQIV